MSIQAEVGREIIKALHVDLLSSAHCNSKSLHSKVFTVIATPAVQKRARTAKIVIAACILEGRCLCSCRLCIHLSS